MAPSTEYTVRGAGTGAAFDALAAFTADAPPELGKAPLSILVCMVTEKR